MNDDANKYPNICAVLDGMVAGRVDSWIGLRAELESLLAERDRYGERLRAIHDNCAKATGRGDRGQSVETEVQRLIEKLYDDSAYAVALQEALDVWEGRSCGGDCLAAPCTHCDGTQRIPGRGALLEGLLEEAVGEIEGVEVEYGDTGPKRLSVEIRAALAKNPINGEVARGAMAPRVEDDARARGPESAHSSSGAAEHAPNAGLVDPPSSPTHDEQLTEREQGWRCWTCNLVQKCQGHCEGCGGTDLWPVTVDEPRTVQQQEKP